MAESLQLPLPALSAPQPGNRGDALADKLCALLERRGRPLEVGHVVSQLLRLKGCPERLGRIMVGEIIERDRRLAWHSRDMVGLAPEGWAALDVEQASFCVVDLETTGGSPGRAKVTEIAAVRVQGLEVGESFTTLVDPGHAIPSTIIGVTGITDDMVHGQPDIAQALPLLLDFCGDDVLVAHNAPFDLRFLNYERRRLMGSYFTQPWLDTLALARRLCNGAVERHDLASLSVWADTRVRPIHRALPDAQATAELLIVLLGMMRERGDGTLAGAVALGQWGGSRNAHKLALTESLPQAPGVYVMRDRRGEVLYVGKAVNLRRRVRSYFGPGGKHGRRVGRALDGLERVDHEVCGSEFEALWREARLLREHRPPCNSRGLGGGQYLKLTVAEEYPRLYAVHEPTESGALHVGPVRSSRAVKMALEALHLLYPLRTCRWACRPGTAPEIAAAPCAGPCSGDGSGYAAVVEEVRRLLVDDVAVSAGPLQARIAAAVADGRIPLDDDRVAALLTVLSALGRVRRAATRRAVLLEPSSRPERVVAFFVARGEVVRHESLPVIGAASAIVGGLRAVRRAASGPVPTAALPEVLIVAERLAVRRGTPALVEIPDDATDAEVVRLVERGVAWVAATECPVAPAQEAQDEAA